MVAIKLSPVCSFLIDALQIINKSFSKQMFFMFITVKISLSLCPHKSDSKVYTALVIIFWQFTGFQYKFDSPKLKLTNY